MKEIFKFFFIRRKNNTDNLSTYSKNMNINDIINVLYESLNEPTLVFEYGNDMKDHEEILRSAIYEVREDIKDKSGFIFPPVSCMNNEFLQENELIFKINGKESINKFIIPNERNIKEEIFSSFYEILNNNIEEIFSNETVEKYINITAKKNSKMMSNISYMLTTAEIKYIFIHLLTRGKSIKNISLIFEKIAKCLFIDKIQDFKIISKMVSDEV